jgi:hypothetical protein
VAGVAARCRVLPSFTPLERCIDEVFEPSPVEETVERPPCCDMSDHHHPLALVLLGELIDEASYSRDGLSPAFPFRERSIES